jgi:hypothetical protein
MTKKYLAPEMKIKLFLDNEKIIEEIDLKK